MNKKIIFTDIDDTLIPKEGHISDQNKRFIQELVQKGHYVVLSSGRPTAGMFALLDELDLPKNRQIISSFNGGVIYDAAQHNVLYADYISTEDVEILFNEAKKIGINALAYSETSIIALENDEYASLEAHLNNMDIQLYTKPFASSKVMFVGPEEEVQKAKKYMKTYYGTQFAIDTSKPIFLEINNFTVSKGSAVLKLCQILDAPIEATIGIGDGNNDIDLLKTTYVSIALENGTKELKGIADYIGKACIDDGFYHSLKILEF